jgi:hypothetical protein
MATTEDYHIVAILIYLEYIYQITKTSKREWFKMAMPIELGLVLEGEDAKVFLKNMENPVVTKEMIQTIKKSREIYEKNRF